MALCPVPASQETVPGGWEWGHAKSLHKTEETVENVVPPNHPACPTLPPGQREVGDSPTGDRQSPPAIARVATPLPPMTLPSQSWVRDFPLSLLPLLSPPKQ